MKHAHPDRRPRPAAADGKCDPWFDAFTSDEADDELDRQLFAIRESLADFRHL